MHTIYLVHGVVSSIRAHEPLENQGVDLMLYRQACSSCTQFRGSSFNSNDEPPRSWSENPIVDGLMHATEITA